MSVSHHIAKLLEQLKAVNTIPNINRGGCGYVAQAIYEAYSDKVPMQIVYLIDKQSPTLYDVVNRTEPSACSHVMVRIGQYYYDSTGRYTKEVLRKTNTNCTIVNINYKYLVASLRQELHWNPNFDRQTFGSVLFDIFNLPAPLKD